MTNRIGMFACLSVVIVCFGTASFAQMPGMGGRECLARLRQKSPGVRVLVTTERVEALVSVPSSQTVGLDCSISISSPPG